MSAECEHIQIADPLTSLPVNAVVVRAGKMAVTLLPDRCMDIYEVLYDGVQISFTNRAAGLVDPDYRCEGTESFSRSFFGGMLTTCGLIQAGRPCEENGRAFGLHGCISHMPAVSCFEKQDEDSVRIHANILETHPEGERLLLCRNYMISNTGIYLQDRVFNQGITTPFMMMYHINFGAPFLSPALQIDAPLVYAENRDTRRKAKADTVLASFPASSKPETVYYTKLRYGFVKLVSPEVHLASVISFKGFDWMGIWKNPDPARYALGMEPCLCPGLGRKGARERKLLPILEHGKYHTTHLRLSFSNCKGERL